MGAGGSTMDSCLQCAYQLGIHQIWFSQCIWQCTAGFFLSAPSVQCVACPSGTYKTSNGNQSCSNCGMGSYAMSGISCVVCGSGTFSNGSASSACSMCGAGQYGASQNMTACLQCTSLGTWPNSYEGGNGSTGCSQCTWAMPSSVNGINCSYAVPSPSCPDGYYVPYLGSACILCPSGTYCVAGKQPAFCPYTVPLSVQPSISVLNCTSQGATITNGCPANSILMGQYQCIPSAGYYGYTSSSLSLCPYDTYCPQGSLVPISCGGAGLTAPMGSQASSNCTSYMVLPCRPGYFAMNSSSSSFCIGCVAGTHHSALIFVY